MTPAHNPQTLQDFRELIEGGIIAHYNKSGADHLQYNIPTKKLWPAYIHISDPMYDMEEQVKMFHDVICQLGREDLLTARWLPIPQIYDRIYVTDKQMHRLAKARGIILSTEYWRHLEQYAENLFSDTACTCKQLRMMAAADIKQFVRRHCVYATGTEAALAEQKKHLFELWSIVEAVSRNQTDVLERNFSIQLGLGSKGFSEWKLAVARILSPDTQSIGPAGRTNSWANEVLKEFHILQNPPLVGIRGDVTLCMANGDSISLNGRGVIYIDREFARQIKRIATRKVYSVENLTTFNSLPFQADGLVVYTEGFPSLLATDILEQALTDNKIPELYHCGDIDAYGYRILHCIDRRISAHAVAYLMGLQEYERYKHLAIKMTDANRSAFCRMLREDYSPEEKELFLRLLTDELTLEQESLA